MSFTMEYTPGGKAKANTEMEQMIATPEPVTSPEVQEVPDQIEEQPEESGNPAQQEEPIETVKPNVLRQKAAQLDKVMRERDDMYRRIQELEAKNAPVYQPEEDFTIGNDDLVEGKHLSKMSKEMKALKQELNEYKQKTNISTTEVRLRSEFPDFDKIVCADNLMALREAEPYLAESIGNDPDMYRKAVSAYKLIKKMVVPQNDAYEQERALVQKNAAKPKPLASVAPQQGDSPLARANAFANGLTDDLKKQLWKETQQSRGNVL